MANPLVFLGLGAALMYFYDPQAGRRRRADVRNQLDSAQRRLQHARHVVERDARNRYQGLVAETRGAIEAGRREGIASAGTSLVHVAQDSARSWQRERWSPAQRALAGAGGAALAMYGYIRGGLRGMVMCALGGTLVARATANQELGQALRGHGILVEKSIFVDAPVEQVFAYWRDLENLPHWMSHVREVRALGDGRYHWRVDGPAGVPVEWESEMLNVEDNREMTWHTVGDAQVGHVGRIRFEPEKAGTRLQVQMRYMPPGGVVGHAVARVFGADPRTEMDEDLARMKAAIEAAKLPREAAAWRSEEASQNPVRH
jgi:uncharacterized membrane protein